MRSYLYGSLSIRPGKGEDLLVLGAINCKGVVPYFNCFYKYRYIPNELELYILKSC
jgi:hypothetical protein